MKLHIIPDHFYKFYSIGDVIKGLIMLIVLHVVMAPFIAMAAQIFFYGHSFFMLFLVSGISLINIGYFIKAVICYFIYARKMKYLKKNNLLPNPNIDAIWLINRPY